MLVVVSGQGSREKAALTQNLESIADPQDWESNLSFVNHQRHDGGKLCNRSTAQVITVGKTTRENNCVNAMQIGITMPQCHRSATSNSDCSGSIYIIE
jgi:hypothetical protein